MFAQAQRRRVPLHLRPSNVKTSEPSHETRARHLNGVQLIVLDHLNDRWEVTAECSNQCIDGGHVIISTNLLNSPSLYLRVEGLRVISTLLTVPLTLINEVGHIGTKRERNEHNGKREAVDISSTGTHQESPIRLPNEDE